MNILLVAVAYVFTPVLVPGASSVGVWGINDTGHVIVQTETTSGVWFHGKFIELPPAPAEFAATAFGINDAGVITGAAVGADGVQRGFILEGGVYRFFSRSGFGILNTVGRAISNSGLITGTNSFADPAGRLFARGFVYDPGTDTFFDATPPNATGFVIMQGMNRSGVIAGGGNQANLGAVALVWQMGLFADGKGTVPFLSRIQIGSQVFFARARGITDDGTITGFTLDSGGQVGFVGDTIRGFQLLTVPDPSPDNTGTVCEGINNRARVTCFSVDAEGLAHAGFIGSPRGGDD